MIKLPRFDGELTRFEVFNRDQHTCQYYGKETRQLTLDHVISHHQGGEHTWENVASACIPFNCRKAGGTPAEAGMRLSNHPALPYESHRFNVPCHYR